MIRKTVPYKEENYKDIFMIDCPICKKFNYSVKVLIVIPKNIDKARVYCPYNHSFIVNIRNKHNNRLSIEIEDEGR